MLERIAQVFTDSGDAVQQAFLSCGHEIEHAVSLLVESLISDQKILACGNGGSAANAQAFVAMMLNRYQRERPAFPAQILVPDSVTFSAIVGETSFAEVYARPLRAIGQPGDILLALSATGNASNVMLAIEAAHDRGMRVIAFTGYDGGDIHRFLPEGDISINVPLHHHARVHEAHLCILHCLCELIDEQLFGADDA